MGNIKLNPIKATQYFGGISNANPGKIVSMYVFSSELLIVSKLELSVSQAAFASLQLKKSADIE